MGRPSKAIQEIEQRIAVKQLELADIRSQRTGLDAKEWAIREQIADYESILSVLAKGGRKDASDGGNPPGGPFEAL